MIELSSGGHRLLEPFWSPHNGYDAMSKQKGEKLGREDESGSKDYKVWTWWKIYYKNPIYIYICTYIMADL